MKEKWLEELLYRKVKLEKSRTQDARIKTNRMFEQNEGIFYRKANGEKERKGKVPEMDKFVQFRAGIWEDETSTPHSRQGRRNAF